MTKNILDLDYKNAEVFFYRNESFYDGELPNYFHFTKMLWEIRNNIKKFNLEKNIERARNIENTNYCIYTNKDGKYAWRKLQLINPVLYVDFVTYITEKDNWNYITNRIKTLYKSCNGKIICTSLPVAESRKKRSIKASQILEWWEGVEQKSLKYGVEYSYAYTTDITDCYPSIYTHSISWALHDKNVSKKTRDDSLIGNIIDKKLRNMQNGQTNGIPQGSTLMAVIAEILFAYIDTELVSTLKKINKNLDYKIIRYRDDYKIFVNSKKDGEEIIKVLTQVLLEYNFKINPTKTQFYDDVILASIKNDKYNAILQENIFITDNIQKSLIRIHKFLCNFPCSKQMIKILLNINDIIVNKINSPERNIIINQSEVLIGICSQIAYKNPSIDVICCLILSTLIDLLPQNNAEQIIKTIFNKFSSIPHSSIMTMFLQRIAIPYNIKFDYNEKICNIVEDKLENNINEMQLWDFKWLKPPKRFKQILNKQIFIQLSIIKKLSKAINKSEVDIFAEKGY